MGRGQEHGPGETGRDWTEHGLAAVTGTGGEREEGATRAVVSDGHETPTGEVGGDRSSDATEGFDALAGVLAAADASADLFAETLATPGVYLWDWDLATGRVRRHPETEQLFGLPAAELEPVAESFLEHVHPEDRARVAETLEEALTTGESYRLQYGLSCPRTDRATVAEHGTVLTDADGDPVRVVGLNTVLGDRADDRAAERRELEWERALNRTMHEALVRSGTRGDLERSVVDRLHEYGYDLVWIGDRVADELRLQAAAGADDYVTELAPFDLGRGAGVGRGGASGAPRPSGEAGRRPSRDTGGEAVEASRPPGGRGERHRGGHGGPMGDTTGPAEPAVRAVQSGETQYVPAVGEADGADETGETEETGRATRSIDTRWRRSAAARGLGTVVALPLVYNSICHGVLAVYDGEPGALDETARRLLSETADTLAFVVHNVESKNALAADRQIHATIQLRGTEYYLREVLSAAACDTDDTRLVVHETIRQDETRVIQYVSVGGASVDTIADAAADHPVVDDVTTIGTESTRRLQITHSGATPETVLAGTNARVRSTSVTARRADLLVVVPTNGALKAAIDTLEAATESVSLLSTIERDRSATAAEGALDELTERQATVLRAAYHRGYFERPRESSAKEVADSLDICHATLLEHLRLAQERVFRHHFE